MRKIILRIKYMIIMFLIHFLSLVLFFWVTSAFNIHNKLIFKLNIIAFKTMIDIRCSKEEEG